MNVRLNDLRHFIEASDCRTIIEAAKKLHITQPALSESIKRLESDVALKLFYRSRTGIELTATGRLFLTKAKAVIQSLTELDMTQKDETSFGGRSLTIGCHSTVASYVLPKAVKFLKMKAPDFNIQLTHDLSRHIQYEIQRGMIDIGIVINPIPVPDLVMTRLAFDTFNVWSGSKKMKGDVIICDPDLAQTQYILKRWKGRPQKIMATNDFNLINRLVSEDIGFGILPTRAVELSGKKLSKMESLPSFKDEIFLVYRPEFGKLGFERITIQALTFGLSEKKSCLL
jgi:DNA-binding transcriptional LysR family regulator